LTSSIAVFEGYVTFSLGKKGLLFAADHEPQICQYLIEHQSIGMILERIFSDTLKAGTVHRKGPQAGVS
jgi:hypothetical protein